MKFKHQLDIENSIIIQEKEPIKGEHINIKDESSTEPQQSQEKLEQVSV